MSMTMTMTISTLCSSGWRCCPHLPSKITGRAPQFLGCNNNKTQHHLRFVKREALGLGFSGAKSGFWLRAVNGAGLEDRKSSMGDKDDDDEEKELQELRGNSTMPDRFRYLSKQAPDPPLRWPWFLALAFLIYAWRSVLWELSNWRKAVIGIFHFVGYLMKFVLALIFHFIGDPITYTILCIETALHSARSFYSSIVTSAPILELTIIIALASGVLAIGETASPKCVNCQPYLLTIAGVIGYTAVRGFISESLFWLILFGMFSYGRLYKKRDLVTSALPVATVVASVGEPWVRLLAIISFTALAIYQHSKEPPEDKVVAELEPSGGKVPFPLLAVALAIGIRLAAKWAGYRHLTWMIV